MAIDGHRVTNHQDTKDGPKHIETRWPKDNPIDFDTYSMCSCGAKWTHPEGRSEQEKDRIWNAHVNYNRPVQEV